jgi:hypothetical protein
MRISEGEKSPRQEDKNTHPQKHSFYKDNNKIPHSLASALSTANRVSITFIMQKNECKLDTITQWRTGNDHPLPHHPVGCDSQTDQRIQSHIANNTSIRRPVK